jgi:alkylated DNA repair dioxygenase AlkB
MAETTPAGAWVAGSLERHALDATSWVDIGRGWLRDPADVYTALAARVPWKQNTIWRYDHEWAEPRLSAGCTPGVRAPHPALTAVHKALRAAYRVDLTGVGLNWYRNGQDAVGAHRDTDLRWCEETIIAIVTLGARRPWTLTPRTSRAPAFDVSPGPGDLLVMGGRAQTDWLHGVPPAPGVLGGRISLTWRWTSGRGRPERGAGSTAPRYYGGGR